jgi:hypothetical protein
MLIAGTVLDSIVLYCEVANPKIKAVLRADSVIKQRCRTRYGDELFNGAKPGDLPVEQPANLSW